MIYQILVLELVFIQLVLRLTVLWWADDHGGDDACLKQDVWPMSPPSTGDEQPLFALWNHGDWRCPQPGWRHRVVHHRGLHPCTFLYVDLRDSGQLVCFWICQSEKTMWMWQAPAHKHHRSWWNEFPFKDAPSFWFTTEMLQEFFLSPHDVGTLPECSWHCTMGSQMLNLNCRLYQWHRIGTWSPKP